MSEFTNRPSNDSSPCIRQDTDAVSTLTQCQKAVADAEGFLNRHVSDRSMTWPRLDQLQADGKQACPGMALRRPKFNVLIVGALILNFTFRLHAKLQELGRALREHHEKFRCRWEYVGTSVGGFAAHTAEAVRALGGHADLWGAVPAPIPKRFEDFIRKLDIGNHHLVAVPGRVPSSIHLQCDDGHLLIPRAGVLDLPSAQISKNVLQGYDVILVNPGTAPNRLSVLRTIAQVPAMDPAKLTIALSARGDWGGDEYQLLRAFPGWVFFNESEATESAARTGLEGSIDVGAAIQHLKSAMNAATVVATAGGAGAYLMNGESVPIHLTTSLVSNAHAVGAGDTLLAVTALSSATGVPENVCVRRGIAAATRHVAGLSLPSRLTDLDR